MTGLRAAVCVVQLSDEAQALVEQANDAMVYEAIGVGSFHTTIPAGQSSYTVPLGLSYSSLLSLDAVFLPTVKGPNDDPVNPTVDFTNNTYVNLSAGGINGLFSKILLSQNGTTISDYNDYGTFFGIQAKMNGDLSLYKGSASVMMGTRPSNHGNAEDLENGLTLNEIGRRGERIAYGNSRQFASCIAHHSFKKQVYSDLSYDEEQETREIEAKKQQIVRVKQLGINRYKFLDEDIKRYNWNDKEFDEQQLKRPRLCRGRAS